MDQSVTVPKILNETDTDTFFWYQTFPIPIPVLFSVPNFSDSIPRLFLIPIFSDTHTYTTKNLRNSRYQSFFWYRYHPVPVPIIDLLSPKFWLRKSIRY